MVNLVVYYQEYMLCILGITLNGAGALVQWLKLPAWKVGDRTPLWPLSFKETKCFFPATRNNSILRGTSVTER